MRVEEEMSPALWLKKFKHCHEHVTVCIYHDRNQTVGNYRINGHVFYERRYQSHSSNLSEKSPENNADIDRKSSDQVQTCL